MVQAPNHKDIPAEAVDSQELEAEELVQHDLQVVGELPEVDIV